MYYWPGMPKKVFEAFYRELVRDIRANYKERDKYLSVRQIADKFSVSLQTAQKGVRKLSNNGMVSAVPKSGITIISLEQISPVRGKRVMVVSHQHDKRFDQAFMEGILNVARPEEVQVDFIDDSKIDISSIAFGDYLLGLNVDGVITLSFKDSALAFYHALREGLDIVSDIIIDELPLLPAVQTDNYKHAREAGSMMLRKGYKYFLVVGYYPKERNKRYLGFHDGLEHLGENIKYVCISDNAAMRKIDNFYHFFSGDMAVFSTDYATNYILAAKFMQHKVKVKSDNFLVYDCEEDKFHYEGLPPIHSVAPSLRYLGRELVKTLFHKWKTGKYPEPLQRKI